MSEQKTEGKTLKKAHSDLYCWHCGSTNTSLFERDVVLIGVFCARLCTDCRNDWEVFIREHPLHVVLDDMVACVAQIQAKTMHDGVDRLDELKEWQAEERRIKTELFDIAKEWVYTTIDRNF